MNMTAFEKHLGRPMKQSEMADEVEFYVSRILTKEQMEKRKKLFKTYKPKQLQLWDYLEQQY